MSSKLQKGALHGTHDLCRSSCFNIWEFFIYNSSHLCKQIHINNLPFIRAIPKYKLCLHVNLGKFSPQSGTQLSPMQKWRDGGWLKFWASETGCNAILIGLQIDLVLSSISDIIIRSYKLSSRRFNVLSTIWEPSSNTHLVL